MNRIVAVGIAVLFAVIVCGGAEAGVITGGSGTSWTGASEPTMTVTAPGAPPNTATIVNAVTAKSPGNSTTFQFNVSEFNLAPDPDVAPVVWQVTNSIPVVSGPGDIFAYSFSLADNGVVGATITAAAAAGWTTAVDPVNGLWATFVANTLANQTGSGETESLGLTISIPDGPLGVNTFQLRMQAATPEPGSFALLGLGLVGLVGYRRRSRKTRDKEEASDKSETA